MKSELTRVPNQLANGWLIDIIIYSDLKYPNFVNKIANEPRLKEFIMFSPFVSSCLKRQRKKAALAFNI